MRWYWALVWAHGQTASGTDSVEPSVRIGVGVAMAGGKGGCAYYTVAPNKSFYTGNPLSVTRDGTTASSPSELAILRSLKAMSERCAAGGLRRARPG
jgi:hypothetical protein